MTASASGFSSGSAAVRVLDNDPASVRFSFILSPQIIGQPFAVAADAVDSQGYALGGTSVPVTLTATNSEGLSIPLSVSSPMVFTNGKWNGQVTAGIPAARLRCVASSVEPIGASGEFNVLPRPVVASTNLLSFDVAWDAARERLLASVAADDPGYSQPGRFHRSVQRGSYRQLCDRWI